MKKYYAVIDTNVVVSAALRWKSVPGSIIEMALSQIIVPVLNDEIVSEYREVLSRPKFKLTKGIVIRPKEPVHSYTLSGPLSMKVINNKYLIKNGD